MSKRFDTPCKYCIFAKYEGITQTGCEFNRLDLFRNKGIPILEAYDEDKEFYVIKRICNYYRHKKWKFHDAEKKVQEEQILREISIAYKAVIIAGDNVDDLKTTVNSLVRQTLTPKIINVIIPFGIGKYKEIIDFMKECGLPWKVHNITHADINQHKAIDIAVINKPERFYAVFNSGINIPLNTFSQIDYKINQEIEPIVLIKPNDNGDGLVVLYELYMTSKDFRSLGPLYNFEPILDKCPRITDICPTFPE